MTQIIHILKKITKHVVPKKERHNKLVTQSKQILQNTD